jgi:hypothetical protein
LSEVSLKNCINAWFFAQDFWLRDHQYQLFPVPILSRD